MFLGTVFGFTLLILPFLFLGMVLPQVGEIPTPKCHPDRLEHPNRLPEFPASGGCSGHLRQPDGAQTPICIRDARP
jgi:hypothetical protein